ncbi:hypothetical protein FGIG_00935 [Fasciola gigantica]|uniref:Uncharacterized protein n=1 Tax=Fasciola gigantica TaxID=46835 RepID=A0A504XGS6_FASGI|nr:hypothetical protein FGIG_00935 [Fasciola gigantica]
MRDKHLTTCKAQSDCVKLRIDNEDKFDQFLFQTQSENVCSTINLLGLMVVRILQLGLKDGGCVKRRVLARSLIQHGPTVGIHASEMTQHLPANSMDVLIDQGINSS